MDAVPIADLGHKIDILRNLPFEGDLRKFKDTPLARKLSISKSTWTRMKRGETRISFPQRCSLATIFSHVHSLAADDFLLETEAFQKKVTPGYFVEYKRNLAENFKLRELLNQKIDISEHYFSLHLRSQDANHERIDAMNALHESTGRRLCILAPSGSGKTACIRRYLWELQHERGAVFVLRLKTHSNHDVDDPIDLRRWFSEAIEDYAADSEKAELKRLLERRNGIFVIDGFDHLRANAALADQVLGSLESFLVSPDCRVVITARTRSDLRGHFSNFRYFSIEPIERNDLQRFCETVGTCIPPGMHKLLSRLGKSLDPLTILIALAYVRSGTPESDGLPRVAEIDNAYKLLERAVDYILQPQEDDPEHPYNLKHIRPFEILLLRRSVLDLIVDHWDNSARPCRISRTALDAYFIKAKAPYEDAFAREFADYASQFEYAIPKGICLEKSYDAREHDTYVFVHDKFQDYLFARRLARHLERSDPSPFTKEYFSEEILKLLGEALTGMQIDILLAWLRDTRMNLVVRKVAASALGFVSGEATTQIVRLHLRKLFETQNDIGVDGRIAESLWRLGDKSAHRCFIERLASYPDRERHADDVWMPLTFELDLPQKVSYDEETSRTLISLMLESSNPVVRKHALILLFRSTQPVAASAITKYCVNEAMAFSDAARTKAAWTENVSCAPLIRSMLYGIEALARFGSNEETYLIHVISELVCSHDTDMSLTRLIERLNDVRMRLANRPSPSFSTTATGGVEMVPAFHIHVVRHGETRANVMKRFVGCCEDPGLNERGQRQSAAVAQELKKRMGDARESVLVLASPSKRAFQTATVIAERMGLNCICDDGARKVDVGSWSGMTPEEIALHDKEKLERWRRNKWLYAPPGGETLFEVKDRICQAIGKRMSDPAQRTSRVILVTHFHAIQALDKQIDDADHFDPINCSITTYRCSNGVWHAEERNSADHLSRVGYEPVRYV